MADADRVKWEARYQAGSHPEKDPDPLLAEALPHARPGRALDVACGRGRHAVALARAGYRVDAIDIAPAALVSARERADGLPIAWIEADLDTAPLEKGAYALVVCVHFTEEALVPRLLDALAPGGLLVFRARPRALCSHGPRPGQADAWFAALETIAHRETDESIEFVGRKP